MFNAHILRRWLEKNERSALWLSRNANIGEATVYRLLGDQPRQPQLKVLQAISRVTGISLDELVTEETTTRGDAA